MKKVAQIFSIAVTMSLLCSCSSSQTSTERVLDTREVTTKELSTQVKADIPSDVGGAETVYAVGNVFGADIYVSNQTTNETCKKYIEDIHNAFANQDPELFKVYPEIEEMYNNLLESETVMYNDKDNTPQKRLMKFWVDYYIEYMLLQANEKQIYDSIEMTLANQQEHTDEEIAIAKETIELTKTNNDFISSYKKVLMSKFVFINVG